MNQAVTPLKAPNHVIGHTTEVDQQLSQVRQVSPQGCPAKMFLSLGPRGTGGPFNSLGRLRLGPTLSDGGILGDARLRE